MNNRLFSSDNYDLDFQTGFLPKEIPLNQLPDKSILNYRMNQIAFHLPSLLAAKQLRNEIDKLNQEFQNEKLTINIRNKQEQDVALLFLTMLAQAYIWEDKLNPAHEVPAILGNTLNLLCMLQKRFPSLTYSDYALNNFRLLDPYKGITLENIEPILTFTGSKDESWFVKIHIVIESICAKALSAAHEMCSRTDLKDEKLCALLKIITSSMNATIPILSQMKNGCNPDAFFNAIRPNYTGWDQVKSQGNNGVKLDGFTLLGPGLLFSFRGASGAQSSFLPALDAALGIEHERNAMQSALLEFQNYMPRGHRHLIADLKNKNIKQRILLSKNVDLKNAWNEAVDSIALFRRMHISYLGRYVIKPSGKRPEDILGTGGTTLPDYLGSRHEATRAARL